MQCTRCNSEAAKHQSFCETCGACLAEQLTADQVKAELAHAEALRASRDLGGATQALEWLLPQGPQNPIIFTLLGVVYHEQGRHKDAAAAFLSALNCTPNSPSAYFNLGAECQAQGLLAEAAECFDKALQLKPGYSQAEAARSEASRLRSKRLQELSLQLSVANSHTDWPQMEALASQILALDKGHLAATMALARSLENRRDFAGALIVCRDARARFPSASYFPDRCEYLEPIGGPIVDADKALAAAQKALTEHDWAGAHAACRQARQFNPSPRCDLLDGTAYEGEGHHKEARQCYSRAASRDPDLTVAHERLARSLKRERGQAREASKDLLLRTQALRRAGDLEGAMAALARAEDFLRDDPILAVLRAQLFADSGRPEQAIKAAEIAVAQDASFQPAITLIMKLRSGLEQSNAAKTSAALVKLGELRKSQEWLAAEGWEAELFGLIEIRKQNIDAQPGLADRPAVVRCVAQHEARALALAAGVREDRKLFAQCLELYRRLHEIRPDDVAIKKRMDRVRREQRKAAREQLAMARERRLTNDLEGARVAVEAALAIEPGNVSALVLLGGLLEKQRDFDGAINTYQYALSLRPDAEAVQQRLVSCRARAEKHREAVARRQLNQGLRAARILKGFLD